MINPVNYYQLGRKLAIKYPEFTRHLLEDNNDSEDLETFIPELYQRFLIVRPLKKAGRDLTRHRLEFIAVVVKYLDPEALKGEKQLRKGMRAVLATLFCCGHSLISHNLKTIREHLEIYKGFKSDVEKIYSQLNLTPLMP